MTVADRVQINVLLNPHAGTNRGRTEPIDVWMPHAMIACYACGSTLIGGVAKDIGWLCSRCLKQHKRELSR